MDRDHYSLWMIIFMASSFFFHVPAEPFHVDHVRTECSLTRYPQKCSQVLLSSSTQQHQLFASSDDEVDQRRVNMLYSLVHKTKEQTLASTDHLYETLQYQLLEDTKSSVDSHQYHALGFCDELMRMCTKRLDQSMHALKTASISGSKSDIQTWLSGVLTFQEACKDSLTPSDSITTTTSSEISDKINHLSMLTSNALAFANRISGSRRVDTSTTAERKLTSDFPEWVSLDDRKLLEGGAVNNRFKPHVVVAQDGSGDCSTILEGLKMVGTSQKGGGRKVIYIKAGVYKQKLKISEDNVMLVGEGKGSTLITDDSSVGGGSSMPNTATVVVTGDGFFAKNIGFMNSAGADNHQAIALRISSDHAVLYNCMIKGHQDTLYAFANRQFYSGCDIYGSIDYIFGNAAAVFQGCNLLFQKPHHKGINTVMANGRSDPGQNTGFSVQGCKIGAGPELEPVKHSVKSYLGRPWKKYSRAVVMESTIDDSIQSSGWSPWSGGFALNTLYFAEYSNAGSGASTSNRVKWPGFHILSSSEASKFTVSNFIGGSSWIPAGVSVKTGL